MLFSLLHAAAIVTMGTLGGRQLDYQVPRQTTWLLPPGMNYEYELHASKGGNDYPRHRSREEKAAVLTGGLEGQVAPPAKRRRQAAPLDITRRLGM